MAGHPTDKMISWLVCNVLCGVRVSYGENSIAANEGVAMFEIILDHRNERFQDLILLQLAEEAQRASAYVLVGVVKIVAQVVGDEDHLWEKLAIWSVLLDHLRNGASSRERPRRRSWVLRLNGGGLYAGSCAHFPIHEEQLLDLVIIAGHTEADNRHEQLWHDFTIEQQRNQGLEPTNLLLHLRAYTRVHNPESRHAEWLHTPPWPQALRGFRPARANVMVMRRLSHAKKSRRTPHLAVSTYQRT